MALRIIEQAGRTDVGRQRSANEDSLVVRPPLFAVADGMGGAKAGEVASAVAVEAVEGAQESSEPAEAQLAGIVREANRRIYDLAVADESRRGMGTTLTLAKLHGDEVSLAHVGDSRAYRLREGELKQLTRDHSLVAELERSGQITPEAAEHHPQRSIITRALGPEPDVEVDTYTLAGPRGRPVPDLLDGLTSMISDDEVASILRSAGSLDEAADALVRPPNQSGGKDNITVILFRLGEGEPAGTATRPSGPCPATRTRSPERSARLTCRRPRPPRARSRSPRCTACPRTPRSSRRPRAHGRLQAPAPRRRRRGRRWRARRSRCWSWPGWSAASTPSAGRSTSSAPTTPASSRSTRGCPTSCRSGSTSTRRTTRAACPPARSPTRRRARVLDHEWRSRDDAVDLVRALERGELDRAEHPN